MIPKIITSWDDGHPSDVRIAQLLLEYGFRDSIFFWPVKAVAGKPAWAYQIAKDFEIGAHTVNHRILSEIPLEDAYNEISGGKDWLQAAFMQDVVAFCYPRGRYSLEVKDLVIDAGFMWARTTVIGNAIDQPDPFRRPADIHVYPRKEYDGLGFLEYARQAWQLAKEKKYPTFHIWGHSWEIDKLDLWQDLETLFKLITNDRDR